MKHFFKPFLAFGLLACAALKLQGADTVLFGGMKLSYSGKGYVIATPISNQNKWDAWDLSVVDDILGASLASLSIRPIDSQPTNFCVKIRSLAAPALKSLKISFPPGGNGISYIESISVGSSMSSLVISGGDLGSNENGSGRVHIGSDLGKLVISGAKWKEPSGSFSYYGGSLFADIVVRGFLGSMKVQGGNIGFLPNLAWPKQPKIHVADTLGNFLLGSCHIGAKGETGLDYGGFASADLYVDGDMKAFQIKGGGWHNGTVCAAKIGRTAIAGLPYSEYSSECGLVNAAIMSLRASSAGYFTNYPLGAVQIKGADVRNSLISAHGTLKGLNVTAQGPAGGAIENSLVSSGIGYDAGYQSVPVIYASCPNDKIFQCATNRIFTLDFCITNLSPAETYAMAMGNLDLTVGAVISNDYGKTYKGFDSWTISGTNAISGHYVWNPDLSDLDFGGKSAIMVTNAFLSLYYGESPRRRTDFPLKMRVKEKYEDVVSTNYVTSPIITAPMKNVYPGNIAKVACVSVLGSQFLAGIRESRDLEPSHATYLGTLCAFKPLMEAKGNALYSKKDIKLPKVFDFETNQVWIGGQRQETLK